MLRRGNKLKQSPLSFSTIDVNAELRYDDGKLIQMRLKETVGKVRSEICPSTILSHMLHEATLAVYYHVHYNIF